MIGFALIATLLVAAALAFLLWPLLHTGNADDAGGAGSTLAVLRHQLTELDTDLARGTLSEEHYRRARQDLERRVLEEVAGDNAAPGAKPAATPVVAAMLAAAVPVAAVLLYLGIGTPEVLLRQGQPAAATTGSARDATPEELAERAAELAASLEREPDDAGGWAMLARSYYALRRYEDAARAYERVLQLTPEHADLLADYADVLGVLQQGSLTGKPMEMIERALGIDPGQWKALALAGRDAFAREDYTAAIDYWERLKAVAPQDSSIVTTVESWIAEAHAAGGTQAPAPATAAASARVTGTVTLSPGLTGQARPTDSVYIFARAVSGPRMPLAVLRKQVKDLPLAFTLDDSTAMAPEMKLSRFPEVVVGARVSRSGTPMPQSGDLEGTTEPVKVGSSDVAVIIDRALP